MKNKAVGKMNLNWIRNRLLKLIFINCLIFSILYFLIAILFHFLDVNFNKESSNTLENKYEVYSTYPGYKNYDKNTIYKIYKEKDEAKAEYKPFVGYRRKAYAGEYYNIEPEFGFRLSTNHEINNSVWFLGGSTIWGGGVADAATIPSYFAKITNEKVVNMGEGGWNSYQNFNQLQIMLINGYRPKRVIFYFGGIDSDQYCLTKEFPTHGKTQRFKNSIESHKHLINEIKILKDDGVCDFNKFFDAYYNEFIALLKSPYRFFRSTQKDIENNKNSDTNIPFASFTVQKGLYPFCKDKTSAEIAANKTISTLLYTYKILKEFNIPVTFILEPSSSFQSEQYHLDYLQNIEKQMIANRVKHSNYYINAVIKTWDKQCENYGICDIFFDFTKNIFNNDNDIFISYGHISSKGNKIVAEAIAKKLYKYETLQSVEVSVPSPSELMNIKTITLSAINYLLL